MKNCRVHPTHWLISTQVHAVRGAERPRQAQRPRGDPGHAAHERRLSLKATGGRYVDPADAAGLVESVRIYTMFPQMPSPMPSPTATPDEELKARNGDEGRAHEAERPRSPHG